MTVPVPYELAHLLKHLAPSARDEAWTAFVQANSKLILYVARSLGGDHDDVMDRYACVLEQLRRDDFHRLRQRSCNRSVGRRKLGMSTLMASSLATV